MKKTIKTENVLKVYNIISQAKYSKMDDDSKVKVWKITRKLKPVATKFDDDSKDAAEKLKPAGDFTERLQKAQEYERLRNIHEPTIDIMTAADYESFLKEFRDYNELVGKAVKEFADKEVDIDFDLLTEEEFGKLMSSNDWNLSQTVLLGEIISE